MANFVNTPQFYHGKLSGLIFRSIDLSLYLQSISTARSVETNETTGFGLNDKTYMAGTADGTASASGLWDGSVKAIDEEISTALNVDGDDILTFHIGSGAVGSNVRMAAVLTSNYSVEAAPGDLVSCKTDFTIDGGIFAGRLLHRSSITATTTTAAVDFGSAFATDPSGAFVHIHTVANTRSTAVTVKVQHSVDNSVWVDLAPTATINTGTTPALRLDIAGTTNRYVRAVITPTAGTGAIYPIVAFARK
ncbi:major tail protein [Arthrobacter phage Salgado]|uniref:Major tail protein n=2 Tax=Laroyevirus TaxID=1982086 RepID=A0A0U4IHV9_9CAUD|nr:major tail protein [Arthrobacter phage Laroye]YP_010082673.1 major tail protein [Arthrobacter phage Salgado]ALY09589.1 major tail protein [Arthrobacter phage Laroye]ALY10230.1 major tail protein [Arthrobacter phage Salgado]